MPPGHNFVPALALILALAGCKAQQAEPPVDIAAVQASEAALPERKFFDVTLSPAAKATVAGQNDFAARLYVALAAGEKGDFMFSPASIAGALALARAGAVGETEAEFAALLKTPGGESGQAAAAELFKASQFAAPDRIVTLANAMWVDSKLTLNPDYSASLKKHFDIASHTADFSGDAAGSAKAINNWASKATRGRIPSIIAPNALTEDTRLMLVNAAYFKARWLTEFDPEITRDEDFIRADGSRTKMPMMKMTAYYKYAKPEPDVQALSLLYRGDETEMLVFLPDATNGLAGLERKLTPEALARWVKAISMGKDEEVVLSLPRFTREGSYELNDVLSKLGLAKAFLPRIADFSGIGTDAGGEPLYLNKVLHKTFIEVNERGTEVAAATAADAAAAAMDADEHRPKIFRADHPFLYMIRDTRTGAILFIGRFMGAAVTG